jgi:hypothetical protein
MKRIALEVSTIARPTFDNYHNVMTATKMPKPSSSKSKHSGFSVDTSV